MSDNTELKPDNYDASDGGADENETTSMFDHFLVFGSFSWIISVDALLVLVIESIVGPMPIIPMVVLLVVFGFLAYRLWDRSLRWIDKAATAVRPDRTELIRTPAIIQNGYERVNGSFWGIVLFYGAVVAWLVVVVLQVGEFVHLFEVPLMGLVFFGFLFPLPIIVWETVVALIAGLALERRS